MMMLNGEDKGPPTKVGFPVVDMATGLFGALAVLAAIHRRTTSNIGCPYRRLAGAIGACNSCGRW